VSVRSANLCVCRVTLHPIDNTRKITCFQFPLVDLGSWPKIRRLSGSAIVISLHHDNLSAEFFKNAYYGTCSRLVIRSNAIAYGELHFCVTLHPKIGGSESITTSVSRCHY
jgi:hypothetical protein